MSERELGFLVVLLSAALISAQAYAGDYGFETTSEGIVDALTRPAPEICCLHGLQYKKD